ncbi:MAG: 4Fe-4S binding protein [Leadbetterella sp.]|nr:4Fe-4S binding protein [Leadbetterella sp.]
MKLYLHMAYFQNIKRGIKTTTKGLSLTLKHLWAARKTKGALNVQDENYFKISEGFVTLQYPHESISVPEIGRYQLDCEIDDCIVCDKCAKICPVDCIEIEAIKSPELIRTTSDGSPVRLHAAKFDIDLAKCCFCGLCTTVCPTECLTMNSEYDYSVLDVSLLNLAFSNLSEKEAEEKRTLYDQFVAEKEAAKLAKAEVAAPKSDTVSAFKPKIPSAFQPKPPTLIDEIKTEVEAAKKPTQSEIIRENLEEIPAERPKPIFSPKKPIISAPEHKEVVENKSEELKPKFVPKKPTTAVETPFENITPTERPKFLPKKPVEITKENSEAQTNLKYIPKKPSAIVPEEIVSLNSNIDLKPKFVPKKPAEVVSEVKPTGFTPKLKPDIDINENNANPKPAGFVPKLKPTITDNTAIESNQEVDSGVETPKEAAKFVPKLKPKS